MAIYKDRHYGKFVQMHNFIARSTTLSLRAKGLLSILLSYPETWKFNVNSLARDCKESVTAIRTALSELIKAGHVERIRKRTSSGQFDYEFNVYETPQTESDKPSASEPEKKEPPVKKATINCPNTTLPLAESPQPVNETSIPIYNKKRNTKKEERKKSEKSTRMQASSFSKPKRKFGCYQNVPLTDEEYQYLCEYYGLKDTDRSIESMSKYIASNGKKYTNTMVRLEQWIEEDIEKYGYAEPPKIPTQEEIDQMFKRTNEILKKCGFKAIKRKGATL